MTDTNAFYATHPQRPNLQNYVVGFLFRNQSSEVALIEKDRPEWVRGTTGPNGEISREPGL